MLDLVPGIIAVDEAYGQFAPWSAIELAESEPRLVVVRTFSKTWAMAGLASDTSSRDPDVVAALSNVALPYHLDAFKQAAGRLALGFDKEMRGGSPPRSRSGNASPGRCRPPGRGLALRRQLRPVPRRARAGAEVWRGLLERSVLVRDISAWPGLEGCLRVTIGTPAENDRFLAALGEVLAGPDAPSDRLALARPRPAAGLRCAQPKRPWM